MLRIFESILITAGHTVEPSVGQQVTGYFEHKIHLLTTKSCSPSCESISDFSSFTTFASRGPLSTSFRIFWTRVSSPCTSPSTYVSDMSFDDQNDILSLVVEEESEVWSYRAIRSVFYPSSNSIAEGFSPGEISTYISSMLILILLVTV